MDKLKVFIADDHPLLRAGLKALLNAQRDMEVVGESSDGASIAAGVAASGADVVLVDVVLPRMNGARVTEQLVKKYPNVRVLAFSAFEDMRYVEEMLSAGALGYVVKRMPSDDLLRAIRSVARGETFLDPSLRQLLQKNRVESKLSRREHAVLKGVARGLALKEIAATLDVSVRSVETYRERAMEKLSLETRAEVITYAAKRGWLLDE
ncbi:MAG TPA: response regulator transcription factor [Polyangiaceae bacterium]|nr:response regulator transcription factor [Polyangiaceae bacterium]